MTHDELALDLAAHLRGAGEVMAWTDMQMGPSGSQRPDVYTIPKTYSRFCPISYEVKVSTADFRGDVTSGKWQGYLKWSAGVVFACEGELLTKDMIPATAGLIRRNKESGLWRSVKRPTLIPCETLPRDAWMKLLIDGVQREHSLQSVNCMNQYLTEQKVRRKLGDDIVDAMQAKRHGTMMKAHYEAETEKARAKHRVAEEELREELKRKMASVRQQLAPEVAVLEQLVGMSINSWGFASELRKFTEQLRVDPRIAAAMSHVRSAGESVAAALAGLERIPKETSKSLTTLSSDSLIDV